MSTFRIVSCLLSLLIALCNSAGMASSRLQGGHSENPNREPVKIAQFFKEIPEQEHRVAEFVNAARVGDKAKVDRFLREGMDINAKNRSGNTALMEACAQGHEDIINLLLDQHADPGIKNNIGETVAIKAIKNRQYKVLDLLRTRKALETKGIFQAIVRYADADFIQREFGRYNQADQKKILADLMPTACISGKTEVVKFFLDKGANPNQAQGAPLRVCSGVQGSPVEAVRLLLDKGADPNLLGSGKESALITACESNRPDVVSLLLQRGANVNTKGPKGKTALIDAADGQASKDTIVKILLDKGADINITDDSGSTALHNASACGRVQAARLLLDRGANVNSKGKDGVTPLQMATWVGSMEMVELLLAKGANVNARADKGGTPLSAAQRKGHKKIEDLLRRHGAR